MKKSEKPAWTSRDKRLLAGITKRWAKVLFLDCHHIHLKFISKKHDDGRMADASSNSPYQSGHVINLYPDMLAVSPVLRSRAVLHELMHLVTADVKNLLHNVLVGEKFVTWREAKERDEHVVDWLTNIVFDLRPVKKRRPKKKPIKDA